VLKPVRSGRFKCDVRLAERRGKDIAKLKAVLLLLIEGKAVPAGYNDHPLKGD
jgi:mRNA interferase YafQ